jgi:integrase/recombinase XerD
MVYQGLTLISLITFKFEHIDLERVKIYVPSTRKTNARELEIKSPQILSLAQFINESRENTSRFHWMPHRGFYSA